MDELCVIKIFSYTTTIGDRAVQCIGIVFTSRRVLCNAMRAHQDQEGAIIGATDGTYKIHFGGWTLVSFGTYCTRYVNRKYAKHFLPFTFMFVRTEHESTYTELFRATREFCKTIFDISLDFKFGSLDHSWPIANAFRTLWPDICLLTCWPHFKRKSCEQKGRLNDRAYYDTHVAVHIDWIQEARSAEQFSALSEICVAVWRKDVENDYADWFEQQYMSAPWNAWFVSAAGSTMGNVPSQNALESFNGTIKSVCLPWLYANTATVLNESLPSILSYCGKESDVFAGHYGEGPIPADMFVRAKAIVEDKRNHIKYPVPSEPSRTRMVLCNASKYAYTVENRHGVTVTETRVKRYMKSLRGELAKNAQPTSICLHYLSLHCVQVLDDEVEPFQLQTNWVREEILKVRKAYQCGCKASRHNGWICSHILATMAIMGTISLDGALSSLPIRLRPGGQVKVRDALSQDTRDKKFFSVEHLVRLFQKLPARNLHWNVLKEKGNGEIVGTIVKWIPGNGRYKWKVDYSDGSSVELECEALAEAISYSHSVGLAVMGKLL